MWEQDEGMKLWEKPSELWRAIWPQVTVSVRRLWQQSYPTVTAKLPKRVVTTPGGILKADERTDFGFSLNSLSKFSRLGRFCNRTTYSILLSLIFCHIKNNCNWMCCVSSYIIAGNLNSVSPDRRGAEFRDQVRDREFCKWMSHFPQTLTSLASY